MLKITFWNFQPKSVRHGSTVALQWSSPGHRWLIVSSPIGPHSCRPGLVLSKRKSPPSTRREFQASLNQASMVSLLCKFRKREGLAHERDKRRWMPHYATWASPKCSPHRPAIRRRRGVGGKCGRDSAGNSRWLSGTEGASFPTEADR